MIGYKWSLGTAIVALTFCGASAAANAADQERASTQSQTVSDQSRDSDRGGDIVVTATRQETTLQKTPIAITAITQGELDRKQVVSVSDLQRFVPSLQFTLSPVSNGVLFTLRGIGNDSAFSLTGDPEVALYVDGVYSPRAQGAATLAYDLQRIEALRGPQGTLFGRNATVGAIQLVTARATTDKISGYAELVGGDYARFGTRAALNIPVTDTLAVRFAFATESHKGYIKYQQPPTLPGVDAGLFTTSGQRYYSRDQKSGRVSLSWSPSSRFHWNINAEGTLDHGGFPIALMQTPRPGQSHWSALIDTPPNNDLYSVGVRSDMDYDVSDHVQLSYIAGFNRNGGTSQTDFDVGVLPILDGNGAFTGYGSEINRSIYLKADFYSHELQLKSHGNTALNWIVGGFYSKEKNAIRNDIDDRDGYRGGPSSFGISFIQPRRRIESSAVFGQLIWSVTDRLNLTGGLRYNEDRKSSTGGGSVLLYGCPAVTPPNQPPCRGIEGQYPGTTVDQLAALLGPNFFVEHNGTKAKFKKLTYLARADYKLTDDILTYASIGTGFKSGIIDDQGVLTGPETLTNYELGAKMRFFDRKLTLNLAAYYGQFKGFQIGAVLVQYDSAGNIINSKIQTLNAKGANIHGLEFEAVAEPTPNDHIQLSGSWQGTKLRSLLAVDQRVDFGPGPGGIAVQQLSGNELPHAPQFSATLTYEHDFPIGNGGTITPRGTIHYETRSYLSIYNGDRDNRVVAGKPASYGDAFDKQKAYSVSDFSIRYTAPEKRFTIEAFVQNIEDKRVRVNSMAYGTVTDASQFLEILAAPRTFGARARVNF